MDRQRKRRAIIASGVAAALLVAAGGATTAFLVNRSHQRSDDTAAADRAAASFDKAAAHYRSEVKHAIASADRSDAIHMQAGIESSVEVVPKLGDAPAWGRTHSQAYVKSRAAEKTLREPYRQLTSVLAEAVVGQPFISAGLKALSVHTSEFIPEHFLPNGSKVRSVVIPGFRKALARFNKVKIPHGQASVARKIRKELQETINQAEQVADSLDLGRGGLIFPKKEYLSASKALLAYDKALRQRVSAAADEAIGEVNDEESAT